jgi:hypothetical protein
MIAQRMNPDEFPLQLGEHSREALPPSPRPGLEEPLLRLLACGPLVNRAQEHISGVLFLQELHRLLFKSVRPRSGLVLGVSGLLGLPDVPLESLLTIPDEIPRGVFTLLFQFLGGSGGEEEKVGIDRGEVDEGDELVGEGLVFDRGGSKGGGGEGRGRAVGVNGAGLVQEVRDGLRKSERGQTRARATTTKSKNESTLQPTQTPSTQPAY